MGIGHGTVRNKAGKPGWERANERGRGGRKRDGSDSGRHNGNNIERMAL